MILEFQRGIHEGIRREFTRSPCVSRLVSIVPRNCIISTIERRDKYSTLFQDEVKSGWNLFFYVDVKDKNSF